MKKINVLIADDRDIIRDSLKLILSKSKFIKITGEASDGKEVMNLIRKNDYDVVLMDINMPNMGGVEATKKIKELNSSIKVLAHSFSLTPTCIKDMISAGASGFIKKGESGEIYVEAIQTVYNGAIFLSDEVNYKTYDKVVSYLRGSSGKVMLST